VQLKEKQQWVAGDRQWGVIHRGRTYLFTGPEQQRRFMADPDGYAPVMSGLDIVLAVEKRQSIPGCREHGVFLDGKVFLFASEETLEKFSLNPNRYILGIRQGYRPVTTQR
jgi:protein disulfide-isomerase